MIKFRVGDRVRVIGNHLFSGNRWGEQALVGKEGTITDIIIGESYPYPYSVVTDSGIEESFIESDLELLEKTLDNLKHGDVLIDNEGGEHTVIDVLQHSCLVKSSGEELPYWRTISYLKEIGVKVKQSGNALVTVTLEEIAELKGIDVRQLRVKD